MGYKKRLYTGEQDFVPLASITDKISQCMNLKFPASQRFADRDLSALCTARGITFYSRERVIARW